MKTCRFWACYYMLWGVSFWHRKSIEVEVGGIPKIAVSCRPRAYSDLWGFPKSCPGGASKFMRFLMRFWGYFESPKLSKTAPHMTPKFCLKCTSNFDENLTPKLLQNGATLRRPKIRISASCLEAFRVTLRAHKDSHFGPQNGCIFGPEMTENGSQNLIESDIEMNAGTIYKWCRNGVEMMPKCCGFGVEMGGYMGYMG